MNDKKKSDTAADTSADDLSTVRACAWVSELLRRGTRAGSDDALAIERQAEKANPPEGKGNGNVA